MNKIFNSKIFLIFITAVICIGGTVTATTLYHSNQVSYNDTNVEEALNNLYARISKVYYLGVGTSFDIKTLLPSIDYTKLTIDDFVSTGEIADSISSNSNYDNGGNPLRSESSSSLSYI